MKTLVLVGSVLVGCVLAGMLFGVTLATVDPEPWIYLTVSIAVVLLVLPPYIYAVAIAQLLVDPKSVEGVALLRRWRRGCTALQAFGFAALVAVAIIAGVASWAVVVAAAVGVGLWFAASPVGTAVRARLDASPTSEESDRTPLGPAFLKRLSLILAIWFAGTFIAGFLVFIVAVPADALDPAGAIDKVGFGVLIGFALAFFVTMVVCLMRSLGLSRRMRPLLEKTPARQRVVRAAVVGGKDRELTSEESERAVRLASVLWVSMVVQLIQLGLLYGMLTTLRIPDLLDGSSETSSFSLVLVVFLALMAGTLFPVIAVQAVRVRRYANAHGEHVGIDAP